MHISSRLLALLASSLLLTGCGDDDDSTGSGTLDSTLVYREMADPSAAIPVGTTSFLVASDEDNVLRLYSREIGGKPINEFDLSSFLGTTRKQPETDIEGATQLGDLVYWISSHAPNKDGKVRPNRYRLFATAVKSGANSVSVEGHGQPYRNLLSDLISHPELAKLDIASAAKRPPKARGALNIEGLSATPDGRLLIGLRNPIPDGKALVIPLENPPEVVNGNPARLGSVMRLDVGGLGIRSLEYSKDHNCYLVVAGPFDGEEASKLYRWSGNANDAPVHAPEVRFSAWNPEALVFYGDSPKRIQVLSDDGSLKTGGTRNKDLPIAQRFFRSGWIDLE